MKNTSPWRLRALALCLLAFTTACDSGDSADESEMPAEQPLAEPGEEATAGAEAGEAPTAEPAAEEAVPGAELAAPNAGVTFTREELATMPAVLMGHQGSSFNREVRTRDNAWVFLHLANTQGAPSVQRAALSALRHVFTSKPDQAEEKMMIDARFAEVVVSSTSNVDEDIQAAAISALRAAIDGSAETVDAQAIAALIALSTTGSIGQRYAALNVLDNSSTLRTDPAQQAAYIAALDSNEPALIADASFQLNFFHREYADQDGLRTRLVGLLQNPDDGVKGRAAGLLERIVSHTNPHAAEVAAALMPLLQSENMYVWCQTADALAHLRHLPAIPAIMEKIESVDANRHEIRQPGALGGRDLVVNSNASVWSHVGEAAQDALADYSRNLGERFEVDFSRETIVAEIAAQAPTVRAWYATIEGELGQ